MKIASIDIKEDILNGIINRINFGILQWNNIKEKRFPTAIEMTKRQMLNTPTP